MGIFLVRHLFCLCLCLAVAACGYQWQGVHRQASSSVLGDGSKTLRIASVEQSSIYPWVPYMLRSLAWDEITLRKLARLVDQGEADYTLEIRVPSFEIQSSIRDRDEVTLLSTATVRLELVVCHGGSGAVAWRSGVVSYSENYTEPRESTVIQEILTQALYIAMDRMQSAF